MSIAPFAIFALPDGHIVSQQYYITTTKLLTLKPDELALLTRAIKSRNFINSDRFK
jgi:hypothetical protein